MGQQSGSTAVINLTEDPIELFSMLAKTLNVVGELHKPWC